MDGDPTGGPSVALGVNQMLIGVATRKYARSVRLPDGDLAGQARRATKKSSVSRRFVALSTAKLKEWLVADLSALDPLVIQIDGLRVGDHVLVAAIGIDGAGEKHVLVVALGATENAAMVNCWPTWSSAGCNQTSPTCSSLTEPRR